MPEEHVGLRYPDSFKEFLKVYGSCHWFDKVLPIYECPKTPREAREFVTSVGKKLEWLWENMYDEQLKKLDLPLFPEFAAPHSRPGWEDWASLTPAAAAHAGVADGVMRSAERPPRHQREKGSPMRAWAPK